MVDSLSAESEAYLALRRLQTRYADIVWRRAWGEFDRIFLPTTTLTVGHLPVVTGPEQIGKFIGEYIDPLVFNTFSILNAVVDVAPDGDPDVATGRMHIQERLIADQEGARTDLFGVYDDRYKRHDGRWWFAARRFTRLGITAGNLETFASVPKDY